MIKPSDSLPIQFWPVDEDTFNEKAICGLRKQDCFCLPVNCEDEVVLQFQGDNEISIQTLSAIEGQLINIFTEPFTSDLGSFAGSSPGSGIWIWDPAYSGSVKITLALSNTSKRLVRPTTVTAGAVYSVTVQYALTGQHVTLKFYSGSTLIESFLVSDNSGTLGTLTFEFTADTSETQIYFTATDMTGGSAVFYLADVSMDEVTDSGAIIDETPLTQVASGIWQTSLFNLASPAVCEQQVALLLGEYISFLSNDTFQSALTPWANEERGVPGSMWPWSQTAGLAVVAFANSTYAESKYLTQTFSGRPAGYYKISDISRNSNPVVVTSVTYQLWNGSTLVTTGLAYTMNIDVNTPHSAYFYAPSAFDRIKILATRNADASAVTVAIEEAYLYAFTPQYKSDCLDLKEDHACTKLIEYTNSQDFDGITYLSQSPDPVFYLRVGAMFFEEKNPQEIENTKLSSGVIVNLRQTILEKRLLDFDFLPSYMVRKLQKVLMHDTLTIDGEQWIMADAMEDKPVPKYNLKRSSVWLTKIDSVEKNTL